MPFDARSVRFAARHFARMRAWPGALFTAAEFAARPRRELLGRAAPLHRDERFAPFFIVGAGRSGTTLLRRMLMADPAIHLPPEMNELGNAYQIFQRLRTAPWPRLVKSVIDCLASNPSFGALDLEPAALIAALEREPEPRRSFARIIDHIIHAHADSVGRGCSRWGEKTPYNCMWMRQLFAAFPDAKFIHLLRDGVDVVASAMKAGWPQSLEHAMNEWKMSTRRARAFMRAFPGACIEIRYERLVTDPEPALRGICAFVGLAFDVRMIHALEQTAHMPDLRRVDFHPNVEKPVSPASIGKGRRELDAETKRALQAALGRDLRALGYAPALETGGPPGPIPLEAE